MKPLCSECGDRHEKHQGHIWPKAVANAKSVANRSERPVANKSVEWLRVKVWREANKDRYNARQRELMRKRRKEKRDEERTVSGGHADVEPR